VNNPYLARAVFIRSPQTFLSSFDPMIRQHFTLKRHLLRASLYREQFAACVAAWHRFTELARNPSAF
jgi:putative transposase